MRPEHQVLQRVRPAGPAGACPLYVRRSTAPGSPALGSTTLGSPTPDGVRTFSTGTYMNIFHQRNWQRLTGLSDFTLEVRDSAPGLLEVFSFSGSMETKIVRRLSASGERLVFDLPAEAEFCWFDWTPDGLQDDLPEACYAASVPSGRPQVHLALVVTTFERDEDLRRLVNIYSQARREIKEIETATDLYIVNNQPRDAQALDELAQPGIILLHNPVNSGGAGGFSRGAREAVKAEKHSHVVFMDDDIIIDPESWFRTLALLRCLTPKYAGQIVAGAMFLREKPAYCQTMGEAFDQLGLFHNTAGQVDLGGLPETLDILSNLDPDAGFPDLDHVPDSAPLRPYIAWWYCVIPVSLFKSHGFPLPVLFRGDDQEFGLRLGRKTLFLNGICVWHPNIKNKKSDLRSYLEVRNHAIFVTLHFRRWRMALLRLFAYRLANFLAANDYSSAAVVIQALTDYRNFYRHRENSVPETEAKLRACRARFPNDLACPPKVGSPRSIPTFNGNRTLGVITVLAALGGSLIPGFFFRPSPVMAPLSQIKGKFPARYAAYPHSAKVKTFNRQKALTLSLKGLAALAGFLIPTAVARNLKKFTATFGARQGPGGSPLWP